MHCWCFHETWYCQISLKVWVSIWHCVIWYYLDVLPMLPISCLNFALMQIQAQSIFFSRYDNQTHSMMTKEIWDQHLQNCHWHLFLSTIIFLFFRLMQFYEQKMLFDNENRAWNKGSTFSYHIWNIIIMLITWNSNLHTFFKLIGTDRHLPWNVISVWCFDQTLCLVNCYEK